MEDRLSNPHPGRQRRPGLPALALALIGLITVGWWALALWPAGTVTPEWLARTRSACFGSNFTGLPDLRGWIVLIGQPLGMVGILVLAWGDALRHDLAVMTASRSWRAVLGTAAIATLIGVTMVSVKVARAYGMIRFEVADAIGTPKPINIDATSITLVDQSGESVTLGHAAPNGALVTFTFGHCETVCPTIIHDLKRARSQSGRNDVPLMIVTLDPWRDTPERLPSLFTKWELAEGDHLFSGPIDQVNSILDRLDVARSRDTTNGNIDHVATVMAMNTAGTLVLRIDGGWDAVQLLLRDWPGTLRK